MNNLFTIHTLQTLTPYPFLLIQIESISEPPFAPPTNVGSDEDLFLLLTFCQNDFLVLSACNAAARSFALCISAFLRFIEEKLCNSSKPIQYSLATLTFFQKFCNQLFEKVISPKANDSELLMRWIIL